MKKGIVIFGYFGRGNLGDEKNLDQIAALVRQKSPDKSLTVITADPEETGSRLNVNTVGKFDFWGVEKALWRSRFLIGGCGNIFQDQTSLRSLIYYSFLVFLAKLNGCRVVLYGQGVGPIRTRIGKWIAARAFALSDLIIARDRLSVGALWDLNAIRSELHFTMEPLVALPALPTEQVRNVWESLTKRGQPKIGLIMNMTSIMDKFFWVNFIQYLHFTQSIGLYLIAIDSEDAGWAETAVRHGAVFIRENRDWERLQCIIGGLDLVVSAKLHGLVAAVNQGVPCFGLAADPKIEGFCLQMEIPFERVTVGNDPLRLSETVTGLLAKPLEERRRWFAKLDFWKALARENGHILTDYLNRQNE